MNIISYNFKVCDREFRKQELGVTNLQGSKLKLLETSQQHFLNFKDHAPHICDIFKCQNLENVDIETNSNAVKALQLRKIFSQSSLFISKLTFNFCSSRCPFNSPPFLKFDLPSVK